jgi:hypothetical protein
MDITLKVASSTQTENGNFCNKLVAESTVDTAFGGASTRQTFYLFTDKQNPVGTEGKLDLSSFDVVDKAWVNPDGDSMTLKYLYPAR